MFLGTLVLTKSHCFCTKMEITNVQEGSQYRNAAKH